MTASSRFGFKKAFPKIVGVGLLLFPAMGLVLMDVQGVLRGGLTGTTVASVGGADIGTQDFDRTVKKILSNQNMPVQAAYHYGFIDRLLGARLQEKALEKSAKDLGLEVSDARVSSMLAEVLGPIASAREGVTTRDVLQEFLRQRGMNEAELLSVTKNELARDLVRNAVMTGTGFLPRQAAEDLFLLQHETRDLSFVVLSNASVKAAPLPEEEALKTYYETVRSSYAVPETRAFSYVLLEPSHMENRIEIPDVDIRATFDKAPESYALPERRKVLQAIVNSKSLADRILEKTKAGSSLREAVVSVTGSSNAYLGDSLLEQSGLAEPVAEAVFGASEKTYTAPVETSLGWHVFQVTEILPAREQSFEEVSEAIRHDLFAQKSADALYETSMTMDDLVAGGASLEDMAKELELTVEPVPPVDSSGDFGTTQKDFEDLGPLEPFALDKDILLETLFSLEEGEVSPTVGLPDGRYVVLRLDTLNPESFRPFEEIRKDVEARWIQDQKHIENLKRAQAFTKALKSGEKTLAAIAKEAGVKVATLKAVKRDSKDLPDALSGAGLSRFFRAGAGDPVLSAEEDAVIVGVVDKISEPETIPEEELAALRKSEEQALRTEYMTLYQQGLLSSYGVTIHRSVLDKLYGQDEEEGF